MTFFKLLGEYTLYIYGVLSAGNSLLTPEPLQEFTYKCVHTVLQLILFSSIVYWHLTRSLGPNPERYLFMSSVSWASKLGGTHPTSGQMSTDVLQHET